MIGVSSSGSNNVFNSLKRLVSGDPFRRLDTYGRMGVSALSSATPRDTGETAGSWEYRIERTSDSISIIWYNTNEVDGVNIAVIRQLGHGTGTGGYVEGIDYINPAIKPIFDRITEAVWKEVIR